MNKEEKILLFETLKDLMIANKDKLPMRFGSISNLDNIIGKLKNTMRDDKKEYEIAKNACENTGCFLPEEHYFHTAVTNTPAFIREYFYQKGWEECQKEYEEKSELTHIPQTKPRTAKGEGAINAESVSPLTRRNEDKTGDSKSTDDKIGDVLNEDY